MPPEEILSLYGFRSGLHDYVDTEIPDDAFSDGQNIELGANYFPVKSLGHYKYNAVTLGANPVRGAALYVLADGTRYYVVACGGKLYYSIVGSGTFTAYQIGSADLTMDADVDVEMVQYLDYLWVVNGKYPIITNTGFSTTRMIRISGTTVNEETTGTADSGTPTTLVDSALTQADDYWNGGFLAITAGTNAGEVRSVSDFVAGTDTVTVSVAFSNPIDATSVYAIYSRIGDDNTPQGGEIIIAHDERLVIGKSDDQTNGFYYSEPFEPENWTPEYGLNYDFIGKDDGETMTSMISYQGYIVITKPRNVYRYSTQGDHTQWSWTRADTHLGCLYHRTLKEFFGRLIYLSPEGVVLFDGNNAVIISDNIEDTIANLPQLKINIRQWLQSTTAEFNTGIAGSKLVDTSDNELKAIPQTSDADWNAGTKTQVTVADGNVAITLKPGGATGDLALNKPTYSWTDRPGYPASNGNDDNDNSWWWGGGNEPTQWWKVDMGANYLIRLIGSNITHPGTVLIQGSTNDVDWTTLVTRVAPSFGMSFSVVTEGTYRYIRAYFASGGIECRVYGVLVYSPYYDNGNIITQSLDFGFIPSALGNLAAEITNIGDSSITFQTRTSADNVDWSDAWQDIGSAGENNGAINSTARRYIQWKAILTAVSNKNATPILHQGYIGVIFQSATKDLGTAPASWGKFESAYTTQGQTIEWWMRSATTEGGLAGATWYQQTPGNAIVSVAVNQWIQYSIRLNSVLYSGVPTVDSVQINYYTGTALLSPCAIVWKDYYKLNVTDVGSFTNDIMYQYNKEGYWLPPRTNKKNNIYFIDEDKLVSGTSESDGFVRINDTGTQDDTTDIDSWFETKNFELVAMTKLFRRMHITSISDNDWTFSYSLDGGAYTDITISLQSLVTTVKKILSGIARGVYIKFKIRQSSEDANWEFHKATIFWKPLRVLNRDQ